VRHILLVLLAKIFERQRAAAELERLEKIDGAEAMPRRSPRSEALRSVTRLHS
jgi:hypothetical protein